MREANVTNRDSESLKWYSINWRIVNATVNNLRQRIYRASVEGDIKKVRNLQKLLLHSKSNKLLAIRRVTQQNQGRNTPGIDGIVIDTDAGREQLYQYLNKSITEKACPAKRVYIPKKNGERRPLGLPVIVDRCRQAIVKSALEPHWEEKFEASSYGFRPGRGAHDAIQKIYCIAPAGKKRQWVLDADIKGAFDNISHEFLIRAVGNFPARELIYQWLKAGVMENGHYQSTEKGTPQGGVISPLLANIAFHGMENVLEIKHTRLGCLKQACPYALVRYADDFVVFGKTQESCEKAKTLLEPWLLERGLELSEKKTHIRHLKEGFDYLGFTVRHYPTRGKKRGYVLLIKPSKESIKKYKQEMKKNWKESIGTSTENMIRHLNSKITGWCNYFRTGVSKRVFSALDHWMWGRQARYLYRRHPAKQWWWRIKSYFGKIRGRNDRWVFMDKTTNKILLKHAWAEIKRHILIKGSASPDNPELREYWQKRKAKKSQFLYGIKPILEKRQRGICPICGETFDNGELIQVHHVIPKAQGGNNKLSNLRLLQFMILICYHFCKKPWILCKR
ncbi:MAG TPA: group II intron reverse transcriptase/maturase [Chlamydiales bacterium]|nr:group II intron reverse transcriptase/maturase [Chlamydiales bacterium]